MRFIARKPPDPLPINTGRKTTVMTGQSEAKSESEKFVTPCALPTERERKILTILIEECSEITKRATKTLRFGAEEVQPGQPFDNATRLSHEFGDLLEIADLAQREGLLNQTQIDAGRMSKRRQLAKYMQTSAP